jgi:hypothetical protein
MLILQQAADAPPDVAPTALWTRPPGAGGGRSCGEATALAASLGWPFACVGLPGHEVANRVQ